jgi:hypothetical protein
MHFHFLYKICSKYAVYRQIFIFQWEIKQAHNFKVFAYKFLIVSFWVNDWSISARFWTEVD